MPRKRVKPPIIRLTRRQIEERARDRQLQRAHAIKRFPFKRTLRPGFVDPLAGP